MQLSKVENLCPAIQIKNVDKIFNQGKQNEIQVLFDINLEIQKGEFVAIVGESGSGKSTLMNIVGTLDKPSHGSYLLNGEDTSVMSDKKLSEIRNKEIGFVFQTFNLIPRTTALANVELPLVYAGRNKKESRKRAMELLEMVGMAERMDHYPNQLSGGQNQRVAIARAMANDPTIILADEPTGALDSKTTDLIMDMFHTLHKEYKKTIILITHSQTVADSSERIIRISDGRIVLEREEN